MKKLIAISCLLLFSYGQQTEFVRFSYPEGRYKAFILSYDDGTIQDIELAQLFDQNNLIGTFNLNSKYLSVTRAWPQQNGDTIFQRYVPKDSLNWIYKNHEIAAHGALHQNFTDIDDAEVLKELQTDIEILNALTQRTIESMAYPFGNTNERVAALVASTPLINGRTVSDTHSFDLPTDFYRWNPSCHDSKALPLMEEYLSLEPTELSVFYVWGHSWEFGNPQRWEDMKVLCQKMGQATDVWSVSMGAFSRYLMALERIVVDKNYITNPVDNGVVWIETNKGIQRLSPGQSLQMDTPAYVLGLDVSEKVLR